MSSRRKRVLHVVAAGEIGGAEKMLVDLASRPIWTDADHVVALFTPNPNLFAYFQQANLEIRRGEGALETIGEFLEGSIASKKVEWLRELSQREHIDIFHLHTFASHVLGTRAALRAAKPILRTEHSTRVYDDWSCWPFSKWSLAHANCVIAVSNHVANVAKKRAATKRSKIDVIYNGVDIALFAPAGETCNDRPLHLGLVGRLEPRKNVSLAIKAMERAPDVTLTIAGDGVLRNDLEAQVAASCARDRIHFMGRVSDVRQVYESCDALLCSSKTEGLPIALLEGMAMGRPTITVPVGGVLETVTEDCGWIANTNSADALAACIRSASSTPHEVKRRGAAARIRVEQLFSLQTMCERYGAIYRNL